jgi:hypothetical protein
MKIKARQLKCIVDFILQHTTNHTNRTIRALLKSNPEQFLDLLNDAIDQADVIPSSVVNFIKEVSKQTQQEPTESPNQEPLTKENPTMKNQNKTSKIMSLVAVIKGAWAKAVQLLTSNASKIKLVISAVSVVAVAVMTSKATAILTLIAVVKSKGLIQSIISLFNLTVNLLKNMKDTLGDKLTVVMHFIQSGGLIVLGKLISLKKFVVSKVKQIWNWVTELFIIDGDNDFQRRAA